MNTKEKQLAAAMLELAYEVFSNHGCNDVDDDCYLEWTQTERAEFAKKVYEALDVDIEGWEETDAGFIHIGDCQLMKFFALEIIRERE